MANHPVISPEAWEALKAASIRGVPDSQLAETFGVETGTIRQRRFADSIWKAALANRIQSKPVDDSQKGDNLTGKITERAEMPPVASLAAKVASTVQESISTLGESNRLLALQIAQKGLRQADAAPPEVQSWGDVRALVEIVHKASGMESGNAVQVNVLNSGEFDFVPASVDSMEII
jgi:hypothetical protein